MDDRPEVVRTTITPGHFHPPSISHTTDGKIIGSFGGDEWQIYCHDWASVNRLVHAALEFRNAWQQQMDEDAASKRINNAMADDASDPIRDAARSQDVA